MTYEINFNGKTITVVYENDYIKLIYDGSIFTTYKKEYSDDDLQVLLDSKDETKIAEGIAILNEG
jgi:hypothetical protein|tara:strand:- start:53 stop:247 length:195 start_codon:yes stop_codon:yes gene_type:complete